MSTSVSPERSSAVCSVTTPQRTTLRTHRARVRHLWAGVLWVCAALLLSVTATLAQDGGLLAPPEVQGEILYIPYNVPIMLDGVLDDWAGVPAAVVDRGPRPARTPGENDQFTFALAANGDTLYVAMTVRDANIITGQHGMDFWNEDSLEFYLNLSGDLTAAGYGAGIFQVNVNPGDIGNSDPAAVTLTGTRSGSSGAQARVFATSDGWGFEASVPLGFTPTHGQVIGVQAHANGASAQNRDVKLIWSNADTNDVSYQNPAVFGYGVFYEVGRTDVPQVVIATPEPIDLSSVDWNAMVRATWEGYKQNYIYCGADCADNVGLVFDPNMGYQAVSEGVGYGMLMAVLMNDQPTFDAIYQAAYAHMLDANTGLLHWRIDNTLTLTGMHSATDAELDIALALIFAHTRVQRGEWTLYAGTTPGTRAYDAQANAVIDAIYQYEVYDGRYLTPGDAWGGNGQEIINLSYFMPAWLRIFDQFQGTDRWTPVINQGYRSLMQTDGASLGLAPNWSQANGDPAFPYCEANGLTYCTYEMSWDAIRVPWRIGLDCLWFDDPRACQWSRWSAQFLGTRTAGDFAAMYQLNGDLSPNGGQSELTVGMWLVAALAAQDEALQTRLLELLYGTYAPNALSEGHWGFSARYYYNQSLAWFGAAVLTGDFRNLYQMP